MKLSCRKLNFSLRPRPIRVLPISLSITMVQKGLELDMGDLTNLVTESPVPRLPGYHKSPKRQDLRTVKDF